MSKCEVMTSLSEDHVWSCSPRSKGTSLPKPIASSPRFRPLSLIAWKAAELHLTLVKDIDRKEFIGRRVQFALVNDLFLVELMQTIFVLCRRRSCRDMCTAKEGGRKGEWKNLSLTSSLTSQFLTELTSETGDCRECGDPNAASK